MPPVSTCVGRVGHPEPRHARVETPTSTPSGSKGLLFARWTLACVLTLTPSALLAQSGGPPFPFREEPAPFVVLAGREAFEGKTVTAAPYSATTETEIVQTLIDGNRIVHKTTGFVARDSAGRTRREQSIAAIGPLFGRAGSPRIVAVLDPVAGVAYFLDDTTRTAHKRPLRDRNGPPMIPPPFEGTFRPAAPEHTEETPIGTKIQSGVRVEGVRRTITTPAGAIGNEKAIVTVTERWYSPDLQVLVSTVQQDPRIGEIRYRLTDLAVTEPDPALFSIPAEYKVIVGRGRRGGAPPEPEPPTEDRRAPSNPDRH